ncbi:unnamed protein product [marine sediment metagenome]|uniref:Cyanophage baseplate Pam3 plug gp18 domain-containing protein n=1 Tax=marine sediment metagenome TaxID=412755 RepID=X0S2R3_9ZZZZ
MTTIALPSNFKQIPFTGKNHDEVLTVTLNGELFKIQLSWSNRLSEWCFYLFDIDDKQLCGPKTIRTNTDPTRYAQTNEFPEGRFYVTNFGEDIEAGRDDFGLNKRVRLYYVAAISA